MLWLSNHSVAGIILLAGVHVLLFAFLCIYRGREVLRLRSYLVNVLGARFRRTSEDPDRTVDEVIDSFFHDVRDVLGTRPTGERRELCERLLTKDEDRKYLRKKWFETLYSIARTMIEAYPLAGILGTVLAIGVGLETPRMDALSAAAAPRAQTAPAEASRAAAPARDGAAVKRGIDAISAAQNIVDQFKNAIWSTVYGLGFGLIFMLFNSAVEPSFDRLIEHQTAVREAIRTAKNVLAGESDAGIPAGELAPQAGGQGGGQSLAAHAPAEPEDSV